MRWSDKETRLFVKLYLSHKLLWDTGDDAYKIKYKRKAAYNDIISKFRALTDISLDESKVTMKIRSLKSTYSQELAKIRNRSSDGAPYIPNLGWFEDWHSCILKRQSVLPEGTSLCEDEQKGETEMEDSQNVWLEEENENSENTDTSPNDKDPCTSPTDDYSLLLKTEPDENSELTESPYKSRKRKIKHFNSSFSQSESNSNLELKEDEFDIYGKYIATQLRSLGIERALRVQLQIQNIVSEARIDSLTRRSH